MSDTEHDMIMSLLNDPEQGGVLVHWSLVATFAEPGDVLAVNHSTSENMDVITFAGLTEWMRNVSIDMINGWQLPTLDDEDADSEGSE